MMLAKRLVPCLDVDRGRVVKGVKFVSLRDAGDPVECAARYDAEGADELVFLDITASSDARPIVLDMVRRVADTVFLPFTVGGGVRSRGGRGRAAARGRGQGGGEHRGRERSRAAGAAGPALRLAGGGARHRRARGGRRAPGWEVLRARRPHAHRPRRGGLGARRARRAARARSCSPAWTATAPRTASTCRSRARWRRR